MANPKDNLARVRDHLIDAPTGRWPGLSCRTIKSASPVALRRPGDAGAGRAPDQSASQQASRWEKPLDTGLFECVVIGVDGSLDKGAATELCTQTQKHFCRFFLQQA